jgi:hypothetical protein
MTNDMVTNDLMTNDLMTNDLMTNDLMTNDFETNGFSTSFYIIHFKFSTLNFILSTPYKAYLPLNSGLRFSKNAFTPSLKS